MPWTNDYFYAFDTQSITNLAPATPGIYAIFNRDRYICVGRSADIRKSLLGQVNDIHGVVSKWRPTSFRFEVCSENQAKNRCMSLIIECRPACPVR
jgi:hypothetical protein